MNNNTQPPSLLIVDDDPLITESIAYFLRDAYDIRTAASRPEAVQFLRGGYRPDLALIDLGLPPYPHRPDEGHHLISDLLAHAPATRIIVLSGQQDEANARKARTLGAVDFVAKPADPEQLRHLLDQLRPQPAAGIGALLGNSVAMDKLRALIMQYSSSPFPVLVTGESGSGKELVARELHRRSSRHNGPLLALNCAAISPTLVEPTLFGHNKGAFTGAQQSRAGYFEEAADGTLFLDEIGELPLDLQPKLLRVLENGEFQRVGDTQTRTSHARIIAATNRDLRREVREGRFRADLYHRLSVFTISVPPLRELGNDRLQLLDYFTRQFLQESGGKPFVLDSGAQQLWNRYEFPGNVRELRNIIIRLCAKHPGRHITATQLSEELDDFRTTPELSTASARHDDELLQTARTILQAGAVDLHEILRSWESAYIQAAQELTSGNISQSAKLLGLNRTTLYNRIVTLERYKR